MPLYALANKLDHPRNVYLRELDLVDQLDAALAEAFAPHRVSDTITAMADSQDQPDTDEASTLARSQLADCDRKLAQHRAALEAGADPKIVTGWIAEVEAERRRILATLEGSASRSRRMTREEITAMVQHLGEIIDVLREADLADRAEVYQQLGLRLTYHPDQRKVRVQSQPAAHPCGESVRVRGGT